MSLVYNQIWEEQHSQQSSKRLLIVWEELPAFVRGADSSERDKRMDYFDFILSLSDLSIDHTQSKARGQGAIWLHR